MIQSTILIFTKKATKEYNYIEVILIAKFRELTEKLEGSLEVT